MSKERTLSIIKPDAICKNLIGLIISRFECSNFVMIEGKMLHLTIAQASEFYFEHHEKNFFNDLVSFMISDRVFVQVLESDHAIRRNREIMGVTDPKFALTGTIRSDYGENCIRNVIHGSDSKQSALREIFYFFGT